MNIKAYKTNKIKAGDDLFKILDKYLPELEEESIVVITSKIISICQGRIVKHTDKITKDELVKKEAGLILPEKYVKYGVRLTITDNNLIASAGIDESNGNGYFILWPENPMGEAIKIWSYLRKKFSVKHLGVVISDSHGIILRKGLIGFGLAWCGFEPLKNYIGKPDIFGKKLMVTKANLLDELAPSAVLVMGEGNEQTPLAIISDVQSIKFVNRPATKEEISEMRIDKDDDIYSALLTSVKWKKGKGK